MAQPKVIIYSGRFCGYCTAAERLFQSKKAEYELIKVDEDPAQFEHMMEITGRRTIPQIFIDDYDPHVFIPSMWESNSS